MSGPVRHVLDPCVGDGAFLLGALTCGLTEARLCGVDADPTAVDACRQRIPTSHVVHGDSLLSAGEGGISWSREFPGAHANGGFDLVVGNPPWEVLEAPAHAPDPRTWAYAAALRRSGGDLPATWGICGGKINLFRTAIARSWGLLRSGGVLAFIVPGGLLRDASSRELRGFLLDQGQWLEAWELRSGSDLFPSAHRDLSCCAIWVRKGGRTDAIRIVPEGALDRDLPEGCPTALLLDRPLLDRLGGPDGLIPALASQAELELMIRLWQFPALKTSVAGIRKGDVNLATDRALFVTRPTPLILRTGKEIGPYRVLGPPSRWVDPQGLGSRGGWCKSRVAWRDIADRTLKKRLCATLVPANSVLGDTLNFLVLEGDDREGAYYLAVLNSHVFEWAVRRRSAHNHLGKLTVGPCPAPVYRAGDPGCRQIADLALQAADDPDSALQVDALVALGYGLSASDLALVLEGFPKQPLELKAAITRAFSRALGGSCELPTDTGE